MATEKSEPRVGLIVKVGALAVGTLIVVVAGLTAYYDDIARAEEHRKFGEVKPEALMNLRADEQARLNSGATPIDKAMQQVAARGRMAASPDIAPSFSKDVAPLQGWLKMPAEVPSAMMATEPPPAPGATIGDAGAGSGVDGAVPKGNRPDRARPDGGPVAKPPPKHP
jgi:hypothetical protein